MGLIILFLIIIFVFVSLWVIYVKAGQPGWTSIIPIVNIAVLTEIIGKPWWWTILWFIPIINIIWYIWSWNLLVKSFGKSEGFTIGVIFLPIIFIPILAFGDSQYVKPVDNNIDSPMKDIEQVPEPEPKSKGKIPDDPRIIYKEFSTVKVPEYKQAPRSLELCPGRIVIQSGLDRGRSFNLFGYPSSDGIKLTIGRESPDWKDFLTQANNVHPDQLYAHILIPDPTQTISRLQAELIYHNGKVKVRSKSSVNATIVNEIPLSIEQEADLIPGSSLKAGEVLLSYEI